MKRRSRKPRRTTRVALNLVAMIDVVFLLLIFFMCVNEWRVPEGSLPASIPTGSGRQDEAPEPKRDLPFIRVQITGTGDNVQFQVQERAVDGLDALAEQLVKLAGIDRSVPVVIDANGTVAFRWVIRALNACLKADLNNVAFTAPGAMSKNPRLQRGAPALTGALAAAQPASPSAWASSGGVRP